MYLHDSRRSVLDAYLLSDVDAMAKHNLAAANLFSTGIKNLDKDKKMSSQHEHVFVVNSPPPPDVNYVVYVKDCQFLDVLLNFMLPIILFAWIATLSCRTRQSETKVTQVSAIPLDEKTASLIKN